jgi:hypothetical protein
MSKITICVEHRIGDDDWIEYEYELDVDWEPFVPGVMSGAPEDCYQDEGGGADVIEGNVRRRITSDPKAEWEIVAFSIFLEGYAESEEYEDDPPGKRNGKCKLEKAKDRLDEVAAEMCQEAADGAYEAAMEQKGEDQREERMMGNNWFDEEY